MRRLLDEAGTALMIAIVLATLLGVLGAVIALTAQLELVVAGRRHQGHTLAYAAEGALARALADLSVADWNAALTGTVSSFAHGDPHGMREPGGVVCCGPGSLTMAVQQAADGGGSWGPDTPRWTPYAWGPVSAWLHEGIIRTPVFVAVWIADDPADKDGNPSVDTNHLIRLYAAAVGHGGGRRAVRALVARPTDGAGTPLPRGARLVSLHETRW